MDLISRLVVLRHTFSFSLVVDLVHRLQQCVVVHWVVISSQVSFEAVEWTLQLAILEHHSNALVTERMAAMLQYFW